MPLKKHSFNDDEEPIFDEAVIYKRGEYWQMRMWLAKEGTYARFSLKTRWLPPDVMVGAANNWWARETSIPAIQGQALDAWGRLFAVPVVRAVNL